jgi:hypothetical protein
MLAVSPEELASCYKMIHQECMGWRLFVLVLPNCFCERERDAFRLLDFVHTKKDTHLQPRWFLVLILRKSQRKSIMLLSCCFSAAKVYTYRKGYTPSAMVFSRRPHSSFKKKSWRRAYVVCSPSCSKMCKITADSYMSLRLLVLVLLKFHRKTSHVAFRLLDSMHTK